MLVVARVVAFGLAAILAGSGSGTAATPLVTAQPAPNQAVAPWFADPTKDPPIARDELIRRMREKVK